MDDQNLRQLFIPTTALVGPVSVSSLRAAQRVVLFVLTLLLLMAASLTVRAVAWTELP
jgi:hypothetical protein